MRHSDWRYGTPQSNAVPIGPFYHQKHP
jgi:hypothetical protein